MLHRLRDLFAHARAGHRIGCETCASEEQAALRMMAAYDPRPPGMYGRSGRNTASGSPVDAARREGRL